MPRDDPSLIGQHTLTYTMFSTNYGDSANVYSQSVEVKIELVSCERILPSLFADESDAVTIALDSTSLDPHAGVIDLSDASYQNCEFSSSVTGHEDYHFITLVHGENTVDQIVVDLHSELITSDMTIELLYAWQDVAWQD